MCFAHPETEKDGTDTRRGFGPLFLKDRSEGGIKEVREERRKGEREGRNHGARPFPPQRRARKSPAAERRPGREIKVKAAPSPPGAQAGLCSRSHTHNLGINKVRRAVSAALSEAHPCAFLLPCRSARRGGAFSFFLNIRRRRCIGRRRRQSPPPPPSTAPPARVFPERESDRETYRQSA